MTQRNGQSRGYEQNLTWTTILPILSTKNKSFMTKHIPIRPSCGGLINDSLGTALG